ncbi:hypothetical protein AB1Y20_013575 [Prymnesium parvum]|uniref:Uncharacterized protein n=1 Tax=Prymnesium parvum TaxID=97485 RepID=A0AB34IGN9_PRYPA
MEAHPLLLALANDIASSATASETALLPLLSLCSEAESVVARRTIEQQEARRAELLRQHQQVVATLEAASRYHSSSNFPSPTPSDDAPPAPPRCSTPPRSSDRAVWQQQMLRRLHCYLKRQLRREQQSLLRLSAEAPSLRVVEEPFERTRLAIKQLSADILKVEKARHRLNGQSPPAPTAQRKALADARPPRPASALDATTSPLTPPRHEAVLSPWAEEDLCTSPMPAAVLKDSATSPYVQPTANKGVGTQRPELTDAATSPNAVLPPVAVCHKAEGAPSVRSHAPRRPPLIGFTREEMPTPRVLNLDPSPVSSADGVWGEADEAVDAHALERVQRLLAEEKGCVLAQGFAEEIFAAQGLMTAALGQAICSNSSEKWTTDEVFAPREAYGPREASYGGSSDGWKLKEVCATRGAMCGESSDGWTQEEAHAPREAAMCSEFSHGWKPEEAYAPREAMCSDCAEGWTQEETYAPRVAMGGDCSEAWKQEETYAPSEAMCSDFSHGWKPEEAYAPREAMCSDCAEMWEQEEAYAPRIAMGGDCSEAWKWKQEEAYAPREAMCDVGAEWTQQEAHTWGDETCAPREALCADGAEVRKHTQPWAPRVAREECTGALWVDHSPARLRHVPMGQSPMQAALSEAENDLDTLAAAVDRAMIAGSGEIRAFATPPAGGASEAEKVLSGSSVQSASSGIERLFAKISMGASPSPSAGHLDSFVEERDAVPPFHHYAFPREREVMDPDHLHCFPEESEIKDRRTIEEGPHRLCSKQESIIETELTDESPHRLCSQQEGSFESEPNTVEEGVHRLCSQQAGESNNFSHKTNHLPVLEEVNINSNAMEPSLLEDFDITQLPHRHSFLCEHDSLQKGRATTHTEDSLQTSIPKENDFVHPPRRHASVEENDIAQHTNLHSFADDNRAAHPPPRYSLQAESDVAHHPQRYSLQEEVSDVAAPEESDLAHPIKEGAEYPEESDFAYSEKSDVEKDVPYFEKSEAPHIEEEIFAHPSHGQRVDEKRGTGRNCSLEEEESETVRQAAGGRRLAEPSQLGGGDTGEDKMTPTASQPSSPRSPFNLDCLSQGEGPLQISPLPAAESVSVRLTAQQQVMSHLKTIGLLDTSPSPPAALPHLPSGRAPTHNVRPQQQNSRPSVSRAVFPVAAPPESPFFAGLPPPPPLAAPPPALPPAPPSADTAAHAAEGPRCARVAAAPLQRNRRRRLFGGDTPPREGEAKRTVPFIEARRPAATGEAQLAAHTEGGAPIAMGACV